MNCSHGNMISQTSSNIRSPRTQYLTQRVGSLGIHQFSSVQLVQDGIYALGKAYMHCTPSLRSFPNVAFETVPMFAWLTMALEYIRQPATLGPLKRKNSEYVRRSVFSGQTEIWNTSDSQYSPVKRKIWNTSDSQYSPVKRKIWNTSDGQYSPVKRKNFEYIRQSVFSGQTENLEYIRQSVFAGQTENLEYIRQSVFAGQTEDLEYIRQSVFSRQTEDLEHIRQSVFSAHTEDSEYIFGI